jgi:pseudaminic acid cytidylyltransferase
MNMIGVIPARGGSKGVPGKNIRDLSGKPLIAYTIEAAIESKIFERIIVSTDSKEIAEIAVAYGAEVPFLRPAEISGDLISSDDVVLHALSYYQKQGMDYDEVCKLQPTSPLRNAKHLREAYRLFQEKKADFLVSVCECEHSPLWSGTIADDLRLDNFISEEAKRACRQDLPTYYRLNGAIYMGKTKPYFENKSFLGNNSVAYIMTQEDSVDIDSELDFNVAESIFKMRNL